MALFAADVIDCIILHVQLIAGAARRHIRASTHLKLMDVQYSTIAILQCMTGTKPRFPRDPTPPARTSGIAIVDCDIQEITCIRAHHCYWILALCSQVYMRHSPNMVALL